MFKVFLCIYCVVCLALARIINLQYIGKFSIPDLKISENIWEWDYDSEENPNFPIDCRGVNVGDPAYIIDKHGETHILICTRIKHVEVDHIQYSIGSSDVGPLNDYVTYEIHDDGYATVWLWDKYCPCCGE